ncbi:hypothetical protein CAP35_12925 [Chitinophagaceae bacterium IBVUCB1]|nr:hypothetical protein CAP35_12925 [Chitinophagaceae bacterium IBVUCB1]
MNITKYSPKDARIIRDNEDKTPDELLALGLSQRGYRRLLEHTIEVEETRSAVLQPVSVEAVSLTHVRISPADMPARINLHNKKTGRVVMMGYKAATMLAEKYPNEFELVA